MEMEAFIRLCAESSQAHPTEEKDFLQGRVGIEQGEWLETERW